MTKEEIFAVLKKHIYGQLEGEIQESDIALNKSIMDLGANSLDIVEIVSNTIRELRIKVPREELVTVKNIQGLVDKFFEYRESKKHDSV